MKIRQTRLRNYLIVLGLVIFCGFSSGNAEGLKPKTALVLSGGGARGFAHIGVLKALEEVGFYPDLIVGTSIGAVVGALYAGGNTPDEIERYVRNTKWSNVLVAKPYRDIEFVSQKMLDLPELFALRFDEDFNIIFPKNLITTQALQDRIFQMTIYSEFGARSNYDSLAIPLRIVATDLKTGKSVILKQGNLARAVTASSAFPIVLAPVVLDSMLLVDGGLTNNVPCDVARELGAEFVIAVDVSSKIMSLTTNYDVLDVFGQAMNTLAYFSDTRNLNLADVLIRPAIDPLTAADFDSVSAFVTAGYNATLPFIPVIQQYAYANMPDTTFLRRAVNDLNHTRIRYIRFANNRVTRDYVLRRELLFKEGDLWNLALAKRSMKNLFSTGLFKNVYISPQRVGENLMDLTVEVEEEERTLFSFGARYDSERKASAFISGKYRNFLGAGIDNQVYIITSDWLNKIEWDARTTRIFTTTLTGYTSAYYRYEIVPLYDSFSGKRLEYGEHSRAGLELNAGVQIKRVGLTAFGARLERVSILEAPAANIPRQKYDLASINMRIFVDNTDDVDMPRSGRINNLKLEHFFVKKSKTQFDRLTIESSNYESIDNKTTISTHLRFGFLNKVYSHYERFRLGGVNSLPGFHQDELWGTLLMSFGFGFRSAISSGIYFQARGIFGNVWQGWDNFNWKESRIGVSVGLLVPTPLGPVALDYGYDLKDRDQFYLSIGHNF